MHGWSAAAAGAIPQGRSFGRPVAPEGTAGSRGGWPACAGDAPHDWSAAAAGETPQGRTIGDRAAAAATEGPQSLRGWSTATATRTTTTTGQPQLPLTDPQPPRLIGRRSWGDPPQSRCDRPAGLSRRGSAGPSGWSEGFRPGDLPVPPEVTAGLPRGPRGRPARLTRRRPHAPASPAHPEVSAEPPRLTGPARAAPEGPVSGRSAPHRQEPDGRRAAFAAFAARRVSRVVERPSR